MRPDTFYIVTAPQCPYCDKAIDLIRELKSYSFKTIQVSDDFILRLMNKANLKTVPQIWHGNTYIGGYTDLKKYLTELHTSV